MVEFRVVDRASVNAFIRMELPENQPFVAPNAVTLAQAAYDPSATVFGIWDGETPVGMAAVVDMSHPDADLDEGDDPTGYYIWRLLIAEDHQRRGLGTNFLVFAEAEAKRLGRTHLALTAVPEEEGNPIPFYEKFGFAKSGRVIDDEVELIKRF